MFALRNLSGNLMATLWLASLMRFTWALLPRLDKQIPNKSPGLGILENAALS